MFGSGERGNHFFFLLGVIRKEKKCGMDRGSPSVSGVGRGKKRGGGLRGNDFPKNGGKREYDQQDVDDVEIMAVKRGTGFASWVSKRRNRLVGWWVRIV